MLPTTGKHLSLLCIQLTFHCCYHYPGLDVRFLQSSVCVLARTMSTANFEQVCNYGSCFKETSAVQVLQWNDGVAGGGGDGSAQPGGG